MRSRRDPSGAWMIGASGGGIVLAATLLAVHGCGPEGLAPAVRMTARWAFVFFWLAYTGGAMAALFGSVFTGIARHARSLGLAFAAALGVHLGVVGWLGIATGRVPLQGGVLWFFVVGVLCTGVLVWLSFGVKTFVLGRFWRPLLVMCTTYILIAFGRDFVEGALNVDLRNWLEAVEYLPFALLCLLAVPLRLAAVVRQRMGAGPAAPAADVDREPVSWTTTEVPTFFGPADSPLFGVVHLPIDNQIRGGVLICGSLGKEAMDSARLHRALGEELAQRGFAVLRFDYLGTGDSAYAQGRADAVAEWVRSVGHAVDYLTLIGAESLSAIGIRAGCLILQEYLRRPHSFERVVYLDPPGTGRRYLREHTMLFRAAVGDDAATPGQVSVIGGRFSESAAAQFAAMRIGAEVPGVDEVLLVGRPGETDRQLTALASARTVEAITADGLPDCARPRDVLLPVPFAAVAATAGWIDAKAPAATERAEPHYSTTVTMPADGPGGPDVVESIERVGLRGIFAIRSRPRRSNAEPVKTVLFFVAAKDLHVGPAREWVELSRRLAVAGSQAVRWDPAGLGLSAHIDRDPFRRVYLASDVVDSVAVARHACPDAGALELVGICSGSWYAAQTARHVGAGSAILINQLAWNWRVASTVLSQWYHRKRALAASAAPAVVDEPVRTGGEPRIGRVKVRLGPARDAVKSAMHEHFPRWTLNLLTWLGLVWRPEVVLATLARGGTGVTVVVSPEDLGPFTVQGGRAALQRLRRLPRPPRLIAAPVGDHSANHPAVLAAINEAVLPVGALPDTERVAVPTN